MPIYQEFCLLIYFFDCFNAQHSKSSIVLKIKTKYHRHYHSSILSTRAGGKGGRGKKDEAKKVRLWHEPQTSERGKADEGVFFSGIAIAKMWAEFTCDCEKKNTWIFLPSYHHRRFIKVKRFLCFSSVFLHIFQRRKSYSYNFTVPHKSALMNIQWISVRFIHSKVMQKKKVPTWARLVGDGERAEGGEEAGREWASERASERERKGRKTNLKKKRNGEKSISLFFAFHFFSSALVLLLLSLSLSPVLCENFSPSSPFFSLHLKAFSFLYNTLHFRRTLNSTFFFISALMGEKNGNRTTQEQFESIFTTTPALLSRLICMANTWKMCNIALTKNRTS